MSVREWSKLDYLDPEKVLLGLRKIALMQPLTELPYNAATLRTRELRQYGEGRQCALFCYFAGKSLGLSIKFTMYEKSDYDCIAYFEKDGVNNFIPIQMKELVPENVNTSANLQKLINSLEKYTDSKDLIVAVHLNQCRTIKMSELTFPTLNIGALWFFGANDSNQSVWTIIGNVLKPKAIPYEFPYPRV